MNRFSWMAIAAILCLVTACPKVFQITATLDAAIHPDCDFTINYEGEDLAVYCFQESISGMSSIIAGGHGDAAESSDLSVILPSPSSGNFWISNGSLAAGSAYVVYTDLQGNTYTSIEDSTNLIRVFSISDVDGEWEWIDYNCHIVADSVKMVSGTDTICINKLNIFIEEY